MPNLYDLVNDEAAMEAACEEFARNTALRPRDYQPVAGVLHDTYSLMLETHPEAFDCLIYPAKSSENNEVVADNSPVAMMLDRDERAQEYDAPVLGRAMIAPQQELAFGATYSGLYESFHSAEDAITLLLSVEGLRLYSLVEWREYLSYDSDQTVERVVYVADVKPIGRTLNARMVYICYPLPAMGEKPEVEPETEKPEQPDPCPENPPDVGIL